jgi:dTDP-4-amino-4,6-dideoxygalactose transaminase
MDHAYYKLYAYLRAEALKSGWSRDRVLAEFAARGVPGLSGSCSEIYLERAFTDHGMALPERLPVARELGETSVMFLVHPTIPARAMEEVAGVVTDVIRAATR